MMPLTAPIAVLLLMSVVLGMAAALRRSRKLGFVAVGAFLMTVVLMILLAVSLSAM